MNGLLLDTHVVVWIGNGEPISQQAKSAIDQAYRQGAVYVSAVSAWEITQFAARNRIGFTAPVATWFDRMIAAMGFATLPLTPECAVAAALLPNIHRDPADRFLIATAQKMDLTLVTRDIDIRKYGDGGSVRVLVC
jgi:PIN domain nuclease of toxin-antitoxin system